MSDTLEQLQALLEHSEWEYVNSALNLLDSLIEYDPEALSYVEQHLVVQNGEASIDYDTDFTDELNTYFVHWLALFKPSAVQDITHLKLGDVDDIPEGISTLPNLKTLDIRDCERLKSSDFSHCKVLLNVQQDDIELTEATAIHLIGSYHYWNDPIELNLLATLKRFPNLRELEAPSTLVTDFPTPQSLSEHPIEHFNAFDTKLHLSPCDGATSWFERITTATLPEQVLETFLPWCSNLKHLTIFSFNRLSHDSQTRAIPLSYCPKIESIQLRSGTRSDLSMQLHMHHGYSPKTVAEWEELLTTLRCYGSNGWTRVQELAREQQRVYASRWATGDPSAQNRHFGYTPLLSDKEPLTEVEERWLCHFRIHKTSLEWQVNLADGSYRSYDKCYAIREQAILDMVPEDQLCDFSCDEKGIPEFSFSLERQFPRITQFRYQYLENHYPAFIKTKTFDHFSLHRKNIPSGCLPGDATSVELDASSFTIDMLEGLKRLPSLKRLSLNKAVTNRPADQELLKTYFLNLPHLTSLEICACGLTSLPEEIVSVTKLEQLYLWGNQLETLPQGIATLRHLKILSISNSPASVPTWIWYSSMEKLYHKRYELSSEERQHVSNSNVELIL